MGHDARARTPVSSRVLGVVGELLITAGIIIALFIVWQFWWTDVLASREQDRLISEFYVDNPEPGADAVAPEYRSDPPDIDDGSVRASIGTNNVWGILHVPTFGADYQVGIAEGVGLQTVLDKGSLGHYPETQLPGELGNFAVAGHRQSYGAALWSQPDLGAGDPLIVETADIFYVYRVTGHEVVAPSAIEVLAPVPGSPELSPDGHYMTLTTCHPPFVSNERWITYAELDYWTPRTEGKPKEL